MVGENLEALKRREMLRSVIDKKQVSELINTKFETITPETGLSDAVAKMRALDLYEIPVVEKKKLVGVLSFGSMVKKRAMVAGMKVKGMMDIPPGITAETSITEVAEQFIATNYRNMPVVKGSSLVGIVSRGDVIKIVQGIKEFKDMKASDIMTYDITAVQSKEPIRNALEMMRRIDVRTIPVVDEKFKLAGIIGIRDIINYSWSGGKTAKETRGEKVGNRDPVEVRVDSIMHPAVTTIKPDTTVNDAVKLMLKQEHLHAAGRREGRRQGRTDRLRRARADGLGQGEGRRLHADLRPRGGGPLQPGPDGKGDPDGTGQDRQDPEADAVQHARAEVQRYRQPGQVLAHGAHAHVAEDLHRQRRRLVPDGGDLRPHEAVRRDGHREQGRRRSRSARRCSERRSLRPNPFPNPLLSLGYLISERTSSGPRKTVL